MSRLGVGRETLVVAYDNMGFSLGSARLWWALNYFAHDIRSAFSMGDFGNG